MNTEPHDVESDVAAAWGDYASRSDVAAILAQSDHFVTVIDRVVAANDRKMSPFRHCAWVTEAYPHDGCAEFGPPDEFPCQMTPTLRVALRERFAPPDDGEGCEFPLDLHPDVSVDTFCDEHASRVILDEDRGGYEVLSVEPLAAAVSVQS